MDAAAAAAALASPEQRLRSFGLARAEPRVHTHTHTPARRSSSRADVLTRIPAYRNLYLITRWTPPMHHVSVTVSSAAGESSTHTVVCARGRVRVCACVSQGPCCESPRVPAMLPAIDCTDAVARAEAVAACAAAITARMPGARVGACAYTGFFAECTLTEMLARTCGTAGIKQLLRQQIVEELAAHPSRATGETSVESGEAWIHASAPSDTTGAPPVSSSLSPSASPRSELDRLDLECMLSILDAPVSTARPTSHRTAASAVADMDTAVLVAHYPLIISAAGEVVLFPSSTSAEPGLEHAFMSHATTSVASLRALELHAVAPWLPFSPAEHGSLLVHALRMGNAATRAAALRDVRDLVQCASAVWSSLYAGTYAPSMLVDVVPCVPGETRVVGNPAPSKNAKEDGADATGSPTAWQRPHALYAETRWLRVRTTRGRGSAFLHTATACVRLNDIQTTWNSGEWRIGADGALAPSDAGVHISISAQRVTQQSVEHEVLDAAQSGAWVIELHGTGIDGVETVARTTTPCTMTLHTLSGGVAVATLDSPYFLPHQLRVRCAGRASEGRMSDAAVDYFITLEEVSI